MKNLPKSLSRHARSKNHIQNQIGSARIDFGFEPTAETNISVHKAQVRESREILTDLINVNCFPAQWFPTFFDAFLPLLILKLFIPPLSNVHSSAVQLRWLVLTAMGTMVFIDDNNLINKRGTKTICCQIMALKFVNKPLNNLQI